MRRLSEYLNVAIWQAGLGYIALWFLIFWALDNGPSVFGKSGVCHPDTAKVLFYWVCDRSSPLSILAAVTNTALTVTLWAPVYIAAATVRPEAVAIALPIVLTHIVGLPAAIFVAMRVLLALFQFPRGFFRTAAVDEDAAILARTMASPAEPSRPPYRKVKARDHFGLRGEAR